MHFLKLVMLSLILPLSLSLTACKKDKADIVVAVDKATTHTVEPSAARANVDFGGVEWVAVTATGYGKTMPQAVDSALKSAIEQVNGKRIEAASSSGQASVTYSVNDEQLTLSASELSEIINSKTNGAVSGFKILSQKQTTRPKLVSSTQYSDRQGESHSSNHSNYASNGDAQYSASSDLASANASSSHSSSGSSDYESKTGASDTQFNNHTTKYETVWEVKVETKVAKYRESADAKLPRIVVAMPRTSASSFTIGGNNLSSEDLGKLIKNRLSDSITQTNRFTVLDREFTDEVSKQMTFIESGMVKNQDYARIGQMLATDLIVIPKIDRFEYLKSERKMRVIDRTIASYSGGGTISIQVINAVTGQVVLSESYSAELPTTPPTTMGVGVDGGKLMNILLDSISTELIQNMLIKTFPVSVVSMNGLDLVLNQGGQSVKQGAHYSAVQLGQEVIDPQTGQSLGKMDSPCCTVEITRVGPKMSYGRIVDEGFKFTGNFKPGMIELREEIKNAKPQSAMSELNFVKQAQSADRKPIMRKKSDASARTEPAKNDEDW